jgi:hypothetical protein
MVAEDSGDGFLRLLYGRRHRVRAHAVPLHLAEPSEWNLYVVLLHDNHKSSPTTRHGGAWGERRYSSHSFTTSALGRGEWLASRPGRAFTPGERTPGTPCTGGWVGPKAGLDTEVRGKILCPCRGSDPDRPVVQPVVRHYTA